MLYSNALELAAAKPAFRCRRDSNAAINRIERVINADAGRWNGRAGATNLAILHAQLKIMRRCGALKHGTGSREVALLAGVNSIQPCVQLIGELASAGYLRRVTSAVFGDTVRYMIRIPEPLGGSQVSRSSAFRPYWFYSPGRAGRTDQLPQFPCSMRSSASQAASRQARSLPT